MGTSGWIILAEELPSKFRCGIIRVAAPLAGSNVRVQCTLSHSYHMKLLHSKF